MWSREHEINKVCEICKVLMQIRILLLSSFADEGKFCRITETKAQQGKVTCWHLFHGKPEPVSKSERLFIYIASPHTSGSLMLSLIHCHMSAFSRATVMCEVGFPPVGFQLTSLYPTFLSGRKMRLPPGPSQLPRDRESVW